MTAQTSPRRGPGRPPGGGEDKRERVLTEAVRLFSASGFRGASLADIARAADISKAGLLHHFDSKEALYTEVLRRRDMVDRTGQAVRPGPTAEPPSDVLERWVGLVAHNATTPELVALYVSMSSGAVDSAHPAHSWLSEHYDTSVAGLTAAFERGKGEGTVRPDAPSAELARLLVAATDGLQLQWLCARAEAAPPSASVTPDMATETRVLVDLIAARWFIRASA